MIVLGIESTCDETSAACVKDGRTILSHVIASQVDLHSIYGGVVPELAARHHIDDCLPVIDSALKEASLSIQDIDLLAVSEGPGLIGSLLVGIHTAKTLAWAEKKPLIGVNHIEAHLYAAMMSVDSQLNLQNCFPALGVVLSGGHTSLVFINDIGSYILLGQTIDDAIGESFDKVAKMMSLPYPGGPEIERLALSGDPHRFPLKAGIVQGRPYDFSFSGLKTSVLYTLRKEREKLQGTEESSLLADLAASFQHVSFSNLIQKIQKVLLDRSISSTPPKSLFLGGGVVQNRALRKELEKALTGQIPIFWPEQKLCLDNGAMIAGLGYHIYQSKKIDERDSLVPRTRIPFSSLTQPTS